MAHVTFLGACGVVTGSSTLLEWTDTRLLVDCGLYQGDEELERRNWAPFAFEPARLDAVLLTHAHLDHTGLVPRLVQAGFDGPIYCTKASRGLVSLLLEDAGEIQEEQARWARKKGYSRHEDPKPLYTSRDARRAIRQLETLPFDSRRELRPGIRVSFHRAGHLLGAASIVVEAKGSDGERRRWCFSGDVGRWGVPILRDPAPPEAAIDSLVLESTYGDRLHTARDPDAPEAIDELAAILERTFDRGGVVIIPAFALGRTQEVLYHLSELVERGVVDPDRVYLDSPMAISATEIYDRAESEHDAELEELEESGTDPLHADRFQRARSVEQSKAINNLDGPLVIVASSGMATGGRVVHHLAQRLGDSRNTVVFVGYQAGGTRGRALVHGADSVGLYGRRFPVRAEIRQIHGLSAHGDRDDLLRWLGGLSEAPRRIFLNHGEDPARKALAAAVAEDPGDFPRPQLPLTGERVPW